MITNLINVEYIQDLDLDCVIELTQAPGLSAYNRAERKMYHLSKELSGIVLPSDTFGSHLKDGKTIDDDLELRNFEAAGEVLAEVWSNLVIDDHAVKAEYVSMKPTEDITGFYVSASFKSRHLITTQYMTVALRCDDQECCLPSRTIINKFFPGRRVPALIPILHTESGPKAMSLSADISKESVNFLDVFQRLAMESVLLPEELTKKFQGKVPYDVYFPSLQEKIDNRVCISCGKYFALKISLNEHKLVCKKKKTADRGAPAKKRSINVVASLELSDEFYQEEEEEEENLEESVEDVLEINTLRPVISVPALGGVETILNLKEWLKSPYQLMSEMS